MTLKSPYSPIAVIADDLTGAADTGIQFGRISQPVYLIDSHALTGVQFPESPGVLSVYTNTRHLPADAAGNAIQSAVRHLSALKPRMIFKKIDSCLRGNIGAETDAILDNLGYQVSFVAPAFPAQGRTTMHGVHYLHGTPLAETEMARDPLCPVGESNLPKLLTAQSRFKVGKIDLDILTQSDDTVKTEIERCVKIDCRHIVFDACTQQHLDKVARLALTVFPKAVLVGSAGLAAGMAGFLEKDIRQELTLELPVNDRILWVCGSKSERMAIQVKRLIEETDLAKIAPDPIILADPAQIAPRRHLADVAAKQLAEKSLVLQIGRATDMSKAISAGDVLSGFGQLVADIITQSPPASIFLSGGDTADAVLRTIGTRFIALKKEIIPGLISGIPSGGLLDKKSVVTKAGAFGQEDTLVRLHNIWQKHNEEK